MTGPGRPDDARRVRERMDGDYEAPVLAEPVGGPVPQWQPAPEEAILDAQGEEGPAK